ncbi:MAG: helix-turn-helix transcriptional regulator [Rhodocyclaceae bacterium]|nr:helix-turn-helix transcriptional regulator [Rhodocyclaceae bacterium]
MPERQNEPYPVVRCGDLLAQSAANGGVYRLLDPDLAPEMPALLGHCRTDRLRPGLSVHCTDVRDLHDLITQSEQGESLRVVLVLDGEVDVSFGPRRLDLGAQRAGRVRQAQAAFVALREPELFVRRARRGKRERKVSVTFSREWLAEACADDERAHAGLAGLLERHLTIERWTPTPRAVALAEQLIHPPPQPPLLHRLYLESRAIELAAEALRGLTGATAPRSAAPLRPREQLRIEAVRELLDSGGADGLSLVEIAHRAGSNVSSLQRQFRAAFGMTVFDYLRRGRLLAARHALEMEGCSIVEAACRAGYTNPANFATAYRRQFGITPRQSRAGF